MPDARLLHLTDLMNTPTQTAVYIETKQTLRPAFCMGVIDREAIGMDHGEAERYAIHLITPAKIAKHWEWRLNNKTWRVWTAKPTREQMMEEKWDG